MQWCTVQTNCKNRSVPVEYMYLSVMCVWVKDTTTYVSFFKQRRSNKFLAHKHLRTLTLFHSRYLQRVFMRSKFQSLTLNQTMPLQHIKYDFELAFTKYDIYTYIRTDHKYNIYTDNSTCVCRITTCTYSAFVYILLMHLCMYVRT